MILAGVETAPVLSYEEVLRNVNSGSLMQPFCHEQILGRTVPARALVSRGKPAEGMPTRYG